MKKTYKKWDKFDGDLNEYLGEIPIEIDEEMYNYIAEVIAPGFCINGLVQCGEMTNKKDNIRYYDTVRYFSNIDKYYFLGVLPEFIN